MFGVVIGMGEDVLFGLLVNVVVVAGGRFLGSGRGAWVGRVLFCFAVGMCCWGRG